MTIKIWRGYHSEELKNKIAHAYQNEELLVLCSPLVKEWDFLDQLPAGNVVLVGAWSAELRSEVESRVQNRKQNFDPFPENPIFGIFTSGTSSETQRLVLYSKKNIESSLKSIRGFFETEQIKAVFCYPQPFHVFGLILGYLQSLLFDSRLVFFEGKYGHGAHELWLKTVHEKTLTLGTPTHFYDLIQYCEAKCVNPPQSYSCIIGGAKVSKNLWKDIQTKLNILKPSIGYGATEASPGITHLAPGLEPQGDGEIGHLLPEVEVTQRLGEGYEFKGPNLCLAIIENGKIEFPKSLLIRDRIEKRASDGIWIYQGRYQSMINRGGIKLSIDQVEHRIQELYGISPVMVSVPCKRLGEDIGVIVRDQGWIAKVVHFFKSEHGIELTDRQLMVLQELPLNESHKLDRKKCLSLFLSQFPIPVSQLERFVPHRDSAVWISQVLSVCEGGGECLVRLDAQSNSVTEVGGQLNVRASSYIEWMAQSFAYTQAVNYLRLDDSGFKPPQKVFLAAVNDFEVFGVRGVGEYRVQVQLVRELGPISLVSGQVFDQAGILVASAKMKLFSEK